VAGFIVLADGRAFALNNWATDVVIRTLAAELPAGAFRAWLLAQQSVVVGMGQTSVDVRELAPGNARELLAAIRRVAHGQMRAGDLPPDVDWAAHFGLLADMLDSVERGEPPETLNPHMRDVIPPTGARSGPGWVH
jgi:hypothetical protein